MAYLTTGAHIARFFQITCFTGTGAERIATSRYAMQYNRRNRPRIRIRTARNCQIGVIKDVHEDTTPGYTLTHPTGDPEQEDTRHGPGFIDDQLDLIALRTQQAESLKQFIQDTLQHWQNLLNVTGGDLN